MTQKQSSSWAEKPKVKSYRILGTIAPSSDGKRPFGFQRVRHITNESAFPPVPSRSLYICMIWIKSCLHPTLRNQEVLVDPSQLNCFYYSHQQTILLIVLVTWGEGRVLVTRVIEYIRYTLKSTLKSRLWIRYPLQHNSNVCIRPSLAASQWLVAGRR